MRAMAGQTAGPIKTKLGMGTRVDPGSVLVTWRRRLKPVKLLTEAHKGRENGGPQGRDETIEFAAAW